MVGGIENKVSWRDDDAEIVSGLMMGKIFWLHQKKPIDRGLRGKDTVDEDKNK